MEDVDEKSALGAAPNTWELEGVTLHSFFFFSLTVIAVLFLTM